MAASEELEKETLQSPIAETGNRQDNEEEKNSVYEPGPVEAEIETDNNNNNNNDDNGGTVLQPSGTRTSSVEYSVFSRNLKRYVVVTASWAGFFSPLSSQIYFPTLNTLAADLNVSISLINLTLTSYMVRCDTVLHPDS